MKLATQTSYIVKNPPPGFGGRYFIFVTLTTSCGITGTGEIYAASFAPEVITAMASDIFQRYLEGQNPFQIEQFCRRTHGSGFSHRPDPITARRCQRIRNGLLGHNRQSPRPTGL